MNPKVYKRGGWWRVSLAGVEWFSYPTWRDAFDRAHSISATARQWMGATS